MQVNERILQFKNNLSNCVNVKNKTWTCILKNEKDIEKNTEEYIKNIVNFSDKIQSDYYSDLLKIK